MKTAKPKPEERLIAMTGPLVLASIAGSKTVPYRALLKERVGVGIELNPAYYLDGVSYCRAAAEEMAVPALFDLSNLQAEHEAAA